MRDWVMNSWLHLSHRNFDVWIVTDIAFGYITGIRIKVMRVCAERWEMQTFTLVRVLYSTAMSEIALTEDEPEHNDFGYTLSTHLDNYRFVRSVHCDSVGVRVIVESEITGYDIHAIIGTCARHFDMEFVEEIERCGQTSLEFDIGE